MRDQKVMRAVMRNKEFFPTALSIYLSSTSCNNTHPRYTLYTKYNTYTLAEVNRNDGVLYDFPTYSFSLIFNKTLSKID